MQSRRGLIAGVVLFVAVLGAYWYFSPHLVLYRMQQAAINGDPDGVNDHIDYPALRESMRGQMAAVMTDKMSELKDNPFAALGGMMAIAMVNQLVDSMVRPEVMANAMTTGRLKRAEGPAATASSDAAGDKPQRVHWSLERKGADRVIARPKDEQGVVDANVPGFVFERRGFADWKLTEIRLPPLK